MDSLKLFQKYYLNRQPAAEPVKQTDFAMHLEPVDLKAYKKALFTYTFDTKILATISYRNKPFSPEPFEIFQVDIPASHAANKLLIFAGVHGNEFAATLAVLDLLKDIKQHPQDYTKWHIRIVTPLNPVGLVYQSRYNEAGRDINRDFKDYTTVGGKLQKEVIEQFKPDVLVSLHEGPQDGFFVIAESNTPRDWRQRITESLKQEKITLARKSFFGVRISEGWWQKQRFVYTLQKLCGIYTLGRYAYGQDIILLTTESPWSSRDIAGRKKPHVAVIKTVLGMQL